MPTARRGDVPLEAYAILDIDNFMVEAVIASEIVDVVTITVVPGAVAYRVNYFPQFTVFVDPPGSNADRRGADNQWTMNCEEV